MLHCHERGSRRSGSALDQSRTTFHRRDLGDNREIHCLWVGRYGLICWHEQRGRRFGRGVLVEAFERGVSLLCHFCGRGEVRLGVLILIG